MPGGPVFRTTTRISLPDRAQPDPPRGFHPVDAGHPDVHQDDVDVNRVEHPHGLQPVAINRDGTHTR